MHPTLLICTWFALREYMPSTTILLFSLPALGFLLFVGSRSVARSRSTSRAADRILTGNADDNQIPLFLDLDTHDSVPGSPARVACRTRAPRR